jgi:superfamily II DNA helicase RecQ
MHSMQAYARHTGCLAKKMAKYFDEDIAPCGLCFNCAHVVPPQEFGWEAELLVHTVHCCGSLCTPSIAVDVLMGSSSKSDYLIALKGMAPIKSVWGAGKVHDRLWWFEFIATMHEDGRYFKEPSFEEGKLCGVDKLRMLRLTRAGTAHAASDETRDRIREGGGPDDFEGPSFKVKPTRCMMEPPVRKKRAKPVRSLTRNQKAVFSRLRACRNNCARQHGVLWIHCLSDSAVLAVTKLKPPDPQTDVQQVKADVLDVEGWQSELFTNKPIVSDELSLAFAQVLLDCPDDLSHLTRLYTYDDDRYRMLIFLLVVLLVTSLGAAVVGWPLPCRLPSSHSAVTWTRYKPMLMLSEID